MDQDTTSKSMQEAAWRVEVDRATSADWSSMLDLFEDSNLYQTWSYGAVRWGTKNLSHLVLRRNGELLAMAQLRIVRPTRFNFGMAYLRWGPLYHRRGRAPDPEAAQCMARALREEYVCKRGLLLRILPNAFVGTLRATLFQSSFSRFTEESRTAENTYRTVVLDLSPTMEQLRKNLDAKWRNKLSQAEKKGLKIIAGNGTDEYRTFYRTYQEMWKRKAFETTVSVEEFGRLQQDLPDRQRMRIFICEQDGNPVAGLVASAMGDSAIYLLGATSDDGLNAKGAYLLQWTFIKWLKDNGIRWYDLGGIDPERNPGVYSFKRGLSGTEMYQLSPLVMCNSIVSSTIVNASLAAQRLVRSFGTSHLGRVLRDSRYPPNAPIKQTL